MLVSLEPLFDLLAYLMQNRDRVVSKDDLIAVWEGRIVSESTLTTPHQCARGARSATAANEQR